MNGIENAIEALKNLKHLAPASEIEILEAEKRLGVAFADDYKDYVKKYGVISAKGIELTGVTSSPRLNVADVTMAERELNPHFPQEMYVVENVAIEGVLMLQNTAGNIFELAPYSEPVKKFNSLCEYLRRFASKTDSAVRLEAMGALITALGAEDAERFIGMVKQDALFDYAPATEREKNLAGVR